MKYSVQLNKKRKDRPEVSKYKFDVISETELTISQMKEQAKSSLNISKDAVVSEEKILINDSDKGDDYVIKSRDKVKYVITVDGNK